MGWERQASCEARQLLCLSSLPAVKGFHSKEPNVSPFSEAKWSHCSSFSDKIGQVLGCQLSFHTVLLLTGITNHINQHVYVCFLCSFVVFSLLTQPRSPSSFNYFLSFILLGAHGSEKIVCCCLCLEALETIIFFILIES